MVVWTISAEAGTGGDQVASALADAAGVPLLDRDALELLARASDPEVMGATRIHDLEECIGSGAVTLLSLGIPFSPVASDAVRQLQLQHALPKLGRAVMASAARCCCVLSAPGAFAALGDHPAAVHVRLRAPFEWRVSTYGRTHVVNRKAAEKAVRHDDHVKRAWLRSIYRVDIEDTRHFALVLDASRLSQDRLVATMLAAGGAAAVVPAERREKLDALPT
jgi:cytidylate kinase